MAYNPNYNYNQIIQNAVKDTLEAVTARLKGGWYDYMPDEPTVAEWAYKAAMRKHRFALTREGHKVRDDINQEVSEQYLEIVQGVLE